MNPLQVMFSQKYRQLIKKFSKSASHTPPSPLLFTLGCLFSFQRISATTVAAISSNANAGGGGRRR